MPIFIVVVIGSDQSVGPAYHSVSLEEAYVKLQELAQLVEVKGLPERDYFEDMCSWAKDGYLFCCFISEEC